MERQEFKEKAKKQIDELFAKIDELEAKKDNATKEAKAKINKMIAEMEKFKKDLQEAFRSVEGASDEDWQKKKEVFNSSIQSFKEGFSKLGDLFK